MPIETGYCHVETPADSSQLQYSSDNGAHIEMETDPFRSVLYSALGGITRVES